MSNRRLAKLLSVVFSSLSGVLLAGSTTPEYVPVDRFYIDTSYVAMALSADGSKVAFANGGTVRIYDVAAHQMINELSFSGMACSLKFSPDGAKLGLASSEGSAYLFDLASKGATNVIPAKVGSNTSQWPATCNKARVLFSPSGNFVAFGALWHVAVYDLRNNQTVLSTDKFSPYNVTALAFAPDESKFAAANQDSKIWIWNTSNFKLPPQNFLTGLRGFSFKSVMERVDAMDFSEDQNKIIASVAVTGPMTPNDPNEYSDYQGFSIRRFDLVTGAQDVLMQPFSSAVPPVFSPNSRWGYSVHSASKIVVFDKFSPAYFFDLSPMNGTSERPIVSDISNNLNVIATVHGDRSSMKTVQIWQVKDLSLVSNTNLPHYVVHELKNLNRILYRQRTGVTQSLLQTVDRLTTSQEAVDLKSQMFALYLIIEFVKDVETDAMRDKVLPNLKKYTALWAERLQVSGLKDISFTPQVAEIAFTAIRSSAAAARDYVARSDRDAVESFINDLGRAKSEPDGLTQASLISLLDKHAKVVQMLVRNERTHVYANLILTVSKYLNGVAE